MMPSRKIWLPEQRRCSRHRPNKNIYIDILGKHGDGLAVVADLNQSGIGFYSVCEEKQLEEKFIVFDLVFEREHCLLRSLSARIVFSHKIIPQQNKGAVEASRRYGLQFVNLSNLQKKQLEVITEKYASPENTEDLPG
jgi:hypothetical protein